MKRFRFRFETVLRHRAITEDLRLQEFAHVQAELAACDLRLTGLQNEYHRGMSERPSRIDVEDFPRREQYLDTLRARIDREQQIREGIAARLTDARQALVSARQAREALERIQIADKELYNKEALRAEQNAIDEIATQRFRVRDGVTG